MLVGGAPSPPPHSAGQGTWLGRWVGAPVSALCVLWLWLRLAHGRPPGAPVRLPDQGAGLLCSPDLVLKPGADPAPVVTVCQGENQALGVGPPSWRRGPRALGFLADPPPCPDLQAAQSSWPRAPLRNKVLTHGLFPVSGPRR